MRSGNGTWKEERAGVRVNACPRRSQGTQLRSSQHTPLEGQAEAGTMAENFAAGSSQPSKNWLTRTNTFMLPVAVVDAGEDIVLPLNLLQPFLIGLGRGELLVNPGEA